MVMQPTVTALRLRRGRAMHTMGRIIVPVRLLWALLLACICWVAPGVAYAATGEFPGHSQTNIQETVNYASLDILDYVYPKVANSIRARYPKLAALLTFHGHFRTQHAVDAHTAQVSKVVMPILPQLNHMNGHELRSVLLAIDRVGDWLGYQKSVPLKELATRYGLHFHYNEQWKQWVYDHDYMWRVWKQYPNSDFGKDAFALLLESGFDPSHDCHFGTDNFLRVVRYGEPWLKAHPNDPRNLFVRFSLAQAYHTWWVLGHVPNPVFHNKYHKGSNEAYVRAVRYYKQVGAAVKRMINDQTYSQLESIQYETRGQLRRLQDKKIDFSVYYCPLQ